MKKISLHENFFKDVVFNFFTYEKYLLIDKLVLICGIILNAAFFLLYSVTGISFFHQIDFYMRLINILSVTGIFAINHRVKANEANISRELSELDYTSFFSNEVRKIEVIPLNFVFNENLPLRELKKIYLEKTYVIISTYEREFTFLMQDNEVYLIEDEDTLEMEEVKKLRLTR